MSSAIRVCRAALALISLCVTLHAEQRVTRPFIGITYIDRTEDSPRAVHMHIVQTDLTAPGLRFKLSPPSGGREVVRQTTLEYLRQEWAQLAVRVTLWTTVPAWRRS